MTKNVSFIGLRVFVLGHLMHKQVPLVRMMHAFIFWPCFWGLCLQLFYNDTSANIDSMVDKNS